MEDWIKARPGRVVPASDPDYEDARSRDCRDHRRST